MILIYKLDYIYLYLLYSIYLINMKKKKIEIY